LPRQIVVVLIQLAHGLEHAMDRGPLTPPRGAARLSDRKPKNLDQK
jgi:hypothetical protein